jgi:hypothetical protein
MTTYIDPKYQALINADPEYSQTIADTQAGSIADKASRDAAMRRSLEEFGQMPDFGASASSMGLSAADLASIYTPEAQTIANANTTAGTSTVAKLNQAYADAQRNVINALASRNMMRSSDTGYGLNKANLANTQQNFDARKSMLDYIAGAQSGFAEAERTRQGTLTTSLWAAYYRALENWKNAPAGTPAPTLPTATTPPVTTTTVSPLNPPGTISTPGNRQPTPNGSGPGLTISAPTPTVAKPPTTTLLAPYVPITTPGNRAPTVPWY